MGVVSDEADKPQGMGAFRILRRLSASSRDVFLAADADGKQVVLKVFGAPHRNQGLFDPKIADEASAYARLSHPNIVKVIDLFSADGQFVIALEYVDGTTLNIVRATLERLGTAVPDACWIYIMHSVFAALAEAHAAKDDDGKSAPVVHRGVNPSNVLIAWDGSVKLGNFNVAQSVRVLRDSNPGLAWGSYGYFAPEQVKLESPGKQADVYSAALMLWELLAGRKGIERASLPDAELLKAMASPNFASLEDIRRDIAAPVRYAVRGGLEPDPKRRFVDAIRIRDVLRASGDLDAARTTLCALLDIVRKNAEATTIAPPPMEEPPTAEIISLLPDPVSDAPPPPTPPPPPVVPQFEPVVLAPEPPPTPLGLAREVERELAPMPIIEPFARPNQRRRTIMLAVSAVLGVAVCILLVAMVVHYARGRTPIATTRSDTPLPTPTASAAPTPEPTVAAVATVEPVVATVDSAPPQIASNRGQIIPSGSAVGHRLFVDNHIAGDGSKPIDVACGRHTLRIGSRGKPQSINVPCGGAFMTP